MKLQLKGSCFDTVEEIQCESQKVLDTLGEQDLQAVSQQWKRALSAALGHYLEGDGAQT